MLGQDVDLYLDLTQDLSAGVPREGETMFLPTADGVAFNPPSRTFKWLEFVHREEFRLRTSRASVGQDASRPDERLPRRPAAGRDLAPVSWSPSTPAPSKPAPVVEQARPYRRIFASYSHRDVRIAEQFENYAAIFGDRYLRLLDRPASGREMVGATRGADPPGGRLPIVLVLEFDPVGERPARVGVRARARPPEFRPAHLLGVPDAERSGARPHSRRAQGTAFPSFGGGRRWSSAGTWPGGRCGRFGLSLATRDGLRANESTAVVASRWCPGPIGRCAAHHRCAGSWSYSLRRSCSSDLPAHRPVPANTSTVRDAIGCRHDHQGVVSPKRGPRWTSDDSSSGAGGRS